MSLRGLDVLLRRPEPLETDNGIRVTAIGGFTADESRAIMPASNPDKARDTAKSFVNIMLISGLVGTVLGGAACSLLWPAHRIWGFILGGIFVGAPLGYTAGYIIINNKNEASR